jgi:transposase
VQTAKENVFGRSERLVLPAALRAELERLVAAVMPWLLKLPGVGPISAAQVLVSRSHAARLRSEAAFVALAGANSIPACSGQVTRHRLNLGGDRQLNRALHTIVVARLRDELTTGAYAARRRAEGKSVREIRRCLKREVSRQLFKLLERLTSLGCNWRTSPSSFGVASCRHLEGGAELVQQAGVATAAGE